MSLLDDLIDTAAAPAALEVEEALRRLCDLLSDDGDPVPILIQIRDHALPAARDALEAAARGRRLPAPPPVDTPRPDDTRLCALSERPISRCGCTTCTARRAGTSPAPTGGGMAVGHCPDTGRAAMSCTCPAHTTWRASGDAGDQDCRTCGNTVPVAEFSRSGGGWSKDCPACVAARNGQASRGRGRHQRETQGACVTAVAVRTAPQAPRTPSNPPVPTRPASKPTSAVTSAVGHVGPAAAERWSLPLIPDDGSATLTLGVPDTTLPVWDHVEAAVMSAILGRRVRPADRLPRGLTGRRVSADQVAD